MKIIQLEILNLASLDKQGGEVINFEEGALGDSTIFSIVGPTGSGKSTILDAICLALYNRAPRYPKKKKERGKIEIYGIPDKQEANRLAPTDCRNILTKGKKEGYSKLTFKANNGNVYRAEWHIRFKTKAYDDAITNLFKISIAPDGSLQEEKAEWNDLPSIIGLDYEQFLRTVLIAQGSFASFLTAKEEERYELLEKLIGCEDLYIRIIDEIKSKKDAAMEAFNKANASMESVQQNLLSEEEHQRLEEEIKQLERIEKEIDANKKIIETQLKWYIDDAKMILDLGKLQASVDEAQQELEAFLPFITRLNLHDAISPAVDILKEVKKMESNIADSKKDIEKYDLKTKQQEELILAAKNLLNQLKEAADKAQKEVDDKTPHIQKARELKTKTDSANTTFLEKQKSKTTAEKEKSDAEKAIEDNKSDMEKAQDLLNKAKEEQQKMQSEVDKKKEELKTIAEEAEKTLKAEMLKVEGMNAEELQNQKKRANTDLQNLNSALNVVNLLDKAQVEEQQKKARKKELEDRNSYLSEELAKLDINTLKKEVETLRKTYTLMTSENWNMHRVSLKEGETCPLCGATEHPFKVDETRFDETTSELYNMLQSKEDTLKRQQKDEKEWTGEKKKNEGEIVGLIQRLRQLGTDMEGYEIEWQRLMDWNPQLIKDKKVLEVVLPSYEEKDKEADAKLSFFNNVRKKIDRLTKEKDEAVKKQTKYAEVADSLINKAQEKVNSATTKLAEVRALSPTLLQRQEEKSKTLEDAAEACQQAENDLNELKAAYMLELDGEDPNIVEKRLKKNKEDADEAVARKNEELSKLNTSLGEMKGVLQTKKGQLEKVKENCASKNTELTEWIAQYNNKEDKIQMVSMEVVEDMSHATEDWNAIRKEKEQRNNKVVSSTTLLQNAKDSYDEHLTIKPEKEQEALQAELQELQNNSHNDELVAAKARMKNHDDAVMLLGDKMEELNRVKKTKDDWTHITEAIGGDGKTLRKIAQCYTLSFLIEHANVEIRKFNSRYELLQVKNSLGIRVIDHDRADDVRDTTSLSGGETFIVSLGLALGLSSLSSRNVWFENLFIDEGFGTLDPDMLATVIDSLAMLQTSQGKKVGVISHTNTMSERITTQIRIIKNGSSGSSHIEIYP